MSTFVMSDIHGNYHGYKEMLKKIDFSDRDMLYILGDVVDRGEEGIRILKDMMLRPNVIPILGNHEYMAMISARFLLQEMTEESIGEVEENPEILQGVLEWMDVGGKPTINELSALSDWEREDILDYLSEFSLYETVKVCGKEYVLVHAGLAHFDPERDLDSYRLDELLFESPEYDKVYFGDKYLVTGHLPTRVIWERLEQAQNKDEVYMANHHIAIDCGSGIHDGSLACVRLDDLTVFYEKK